MAGRERKAAENGPDRQPAKSAGVRMNPRKHAGTVAIRREKAPTENSWGFNSGGLGSIECCPTGPIEPRFLKYFQLLYPRLYPRISVDVSIASRHSCCGALASQPKAVAHPYQCDISDVCAL